MSVRSVAELGRDACGAERAARSRGTGGCIRDGVACNLVLSSWSAAQEGVPLVFVDLDNQAEDSDVIAYWRSELEKRLPQLLVGIAVQQYLKSWISTRDKSGGPRRTW